MSLDTKSKRFKSAERACHAVGPLVLSTVPETRCLRIPESQEENVVEHNQTRTTIEASSVDSRLAAALERSFVGNHSDLVEERMSRKSVSYEACVETQGGNLGHVLSLSGGRNAETMLQNVYVHINGFSSVMVWIHLL
jgi:hypothetical protein